MCAVHVLRLALSFVALVESTSSNDTSVGGSLWPKLDYDTWQGWEPSSDFKETFESWPDKRVPDEIAVWCKGFIPSNATNKVVGNFSTMPITGPGGVPIPGLLGMCAAIDGRDWSSAPPMSARPTDARFWASVAVSRGRGNGVTAFANCGLSHNICCEKNGCWGGYKYGAVTCSKHCPDSEMQVKRMACWTAEDTKNGTVWPNHGKSCAGDAIIAAKAYIQGRGGNPCGEVFGVKPPPASWDVGVAIFPTKRKVTITGYVDDAPSYECYAQAKDNAVWGAPVTLARLPMDMSKNIAIELAGHSDRPVNPHGHYFDLPAPSRISTIVV